MKFRIELEKKIEKKKQEIASLEAQIKEAAAYVQGLQEALRMLQKENPLPFNSAKAEATGGGSGPRRTYEQSLRRGGDVYKAWEVLKKEGKPLYIADLVKAIGKEPTKANRKSLSGTLNTYIRDGKVFKRTEANTYGLLEFGTGEVSDDADELPDNFGVDSHEEDTADSPENEIDF
jgi:hypothetical protein